MPGIEIVGTAYVRIRAITAGLSDDIKDGFDKGLKDADLDKSMKESFDKGVKDADLDKSGSDAGEKFASGVGDGVDKDLPGNLDKSISDAAKKAEPNAEKSGHNVGRKVSKGLGDGVDEESKKKSPFQGLLDSFDNIASKIPLGGPKLWAGLFSPNIVGAFAPLISSAIAGITSQLGFLVTAAAGAGVALAGVGAVALPAILPLALAFKANTKEMIAFKKEAEGLVLPWKEVARATQQQLLPGLSAALKSFQAFVPMFQEFGGTIGGIFGDLAKNTGEILTSGKNQAALNAILKESVGFWQQISRAAQAVIDALLPFLAAAAPLATQFATSLADWAEHFRDFINASSQAGTLTSTFQQWYDRLKLVVDIVGNVFKALWNVLNIGAGFADPVWQSIDKVTQKWAEWTKSVEGQTAIQQWFAKAQPVLHELWLLIKDIADLFAGGIFSNDLDTSGTASFIADIRTNWLPILQRLNDALKGRGVGDALRSLADSFVKVIDATAGSGGFVLLLQNMALALDALAVVLANPIVTEIGKWMLTFAFGMKVANYALKPFTEAFSILGKLGVDTLLLKIGQAMGIFGAEATGLGAALVPLLPVLLAVAAAIAIFAAIWIEWDNIVAGLKAAWEWFSKLNPVLQAFIAIIAAPVILAFFASFVGWIFALVAIIKNKDAIIGFFKEVGSAIAGFFQGLPGAVGDAAGAVLDFFTRLPDIIRGLPDSLRGVGSAVKDALVSGLQNLPTAILAALGGLGELGARLIGLIADGLQAALPALAQFFVELPVKALGWLGQAAGLLLRAGIFLLEHVVEGLVQALPAIATFFLTLPLKIATFLRKAAVELAQQGFDLIWALLQGMVRALPSVLKWFTDLPSNITSVLTSAATWLLQTGWAILQGLFNGLVNNFGTIVGWFAALPGAIISAIGDAGSWLLGVGAQLLQGIWNGVLSIWDAFNEFWGNLPQHIVDLITAGGPALLDIGVSILTWIFDGILSIAQTLWDWATNLPSNIVNFITAGAGLLVNVGVSILTWILNGIQSVAETLWGWARAVPGAIVGFITGAFQVLVDVGTSILNWIKDGVVQAAENLWSWFRSLPGKLVDQVSQELNALVDLGKTIIDKVLSGLNAAWHSLASWFQDLPGDLADAAVGGLSDLYDLGRKMVQKILDGIGSLAGSVKDKISDIAHSGGGFNPLNWIASGEVLAKVVPIGAARSAAATMAQPMVPALASGAMFGAPVVASLAEAGRTTTFRRAARPPLEVRRAIALAVQAEAATARGEVTVLRIDQANFGDKVDLDMVSARILTAYKVAAAS